MRRAVSSADVARHAGVSRTTVSFVLNGRTDMVIPEETRARVLRSAQELRYRPNSLARSLVRGRTQTVGLIVPGLDSSFTASIVSGVQEELGRHNYRILLGHSQHDPDIEAKQVALLLEHRVDGLICVVGEGTTERMGQWIDEIVGQGVACVLIDDRTFGDRVDCVVTDDRDGAFQAVSHLIALGHRRIGHLSAGFQVSSAKDRHRGYEAALAAAGLPRDAALAAGGTFEMGAAAVEALLDLPEPPTALFAANDYMAAEALEVVRLRKRRVPDEIAVVGYGDTRVGRYLHLSTVRQDPPCLGRVAARRLLARFVDSRLPPEVIVLPTELLVRESSGGPVSG